MSSRPLPSTVTGRYGYTVYSDGAACLRSTKSLTPRIWLPGARPESSTGTETQPVT